MKLDDMKLDGSGALTLKNENGMDITKNIGELEKIIVVKFLPVPGFIQAFNALMIIFSLMHPILFLYFLVVGIPYVYFGEAKRYIFLQFKDEQKDGGIVKENANKENKYFMIDREKKELVYEKIKKFEEVAENHKIVIELLEKEKLK